jgi:hypothetical protein
MYTTPQTAGAVVMVRPHRFHPNPQTAADNRYQSTQAFSDDDTHEVASRAYDEVSVMVAQLQSAGVQVHLFEDHGECDTPDSVFPNNWFSTHSGGHIAIYPMYAPNRRRERRYDIIDMLKTHYRVQDVIDYSGLEGDGLFLEGTGAMVLDHSERVAYAGMSQRANPVILERFCTHFNFEPMAFPTLGTAGQPVYHTNVMLCIASQFVLAGLDCISDGARRHAVAQRLGAHGRHVIVLTPQQLATFAGNALELRGRHGPVLAMSAQGVASLSRAQRAAIEQHAQLLSISVPTIELAGGSVRCMLAGIHLAAREQLPL